MTAHASRVSRLLLAAEVVQTSAMDCGPAALKCLLEGFGIRVSYGRLREACQTDVDGTSIDTIEEAAVQLGLEAEQVMVPVDHLFLPAARALPALVVVRLATRDRSIKGIRMGVFYERERDDWGFEEWQDERQERLARKDERP